MSANYLSSIRHGSTPTTSPQPALSGDTGRHLMRWGRAGRCRGGDSSRHFVGSSGVVDIDEVIEITTGESSLVSGSTQPWAGGSPTAPMLALRCVERRARIRAGCAPRLSDRSTRRPSTESRPGARSGMTTPNSPSGPPTPNTSSPESARDEPPSIPGGGRAVADPHVGDDHEVAVGRSAAQRAQLGERGSHPARAHARCLRIVRG